jgi:hypothetical protein
MSQPSCFAPGNDPVPTVLWGLAHAWMGAENLDPTGIQPQGHPAHNQSLYLLLLLLYHPTSEIRSNRKQ